MTLHIYLYKRTVIGFWVTLRNFLHWNLANYWVNIFNVPRIQKIEKQKNGRNAHYSNLYFFNNFGMIFLFDTILLLKAYFRREKQLVVGASH
jgi:hypothetical protein